MTNEFDYKSGYQTESMFKEIPVTLNPPLLINQSSESNARFVVPAGVYNWSRAHIDLDILITSATMDALHLGRNMLISGINLTYEGAPQSLVNIQNTRVTNCMTLPQTKLSKFLNRTIHHQNVAGNAAALERGEIYAPVKHNSLVQYDATGAGAVYSGNTYRDLSGMGGYSVGIDQEVNGAVAVPEPIPGDMAPAVAIGKFAPGQATCYVKIRINLSDFKNTLFSQDKTIFYPINAILSVNFAPYQKWGFTCTGTATPSLAGSVDLAGTVTLPQTSVLWVPYENNEKIVRNCQLITNEGLQMRIPYVTVGGGSAATSNGTRAAADVGSVYRYQLPLTQSYGNHILRIYTVVCRNDAGAAFLSSDNTVSPNGAGTLINNMYGSIRSFVGQKEMQQGTLSCLLGEDYRTLKLMLEDSAITNQHVFQKFSFFVDNFTNSNSASNWDEQNSDLGNYSMVNDFGQPKNEVYAVEIGTNFKNCSVFFVVVGQKNMYVKPGVVTCDAV